MPAWREPASPGTTDSLVSPEPSSAVLFASGQPGSDARTGNQTSECCMRGAWSALMQATKQPLRVTWGASGAFVAKKSDATSWHELLH